MQTDWLTWRVTRRERAPVTPWWANEASLSTEKKPRLNHSVAVGDLISFISLYLSVRKSSIVGCGWKPPLIVGLAALFFPAFLAKFLPSSQRYPSPVTLRVEDSVPARNEDGNVVSRHPHHPPSFMTSCNNGTPFCFTLYVTSGLNLTWPFTGVSESCILHPPHPHIHHLPSGKENMY